MDQKIQKRQLERNFATAKKASRIERPAVGWLRTIRKSLNMPAEWLAEKLHVTPSAVRGFEAREADESITLKSLRQAASALDCDLVYFVIPKRSLEDFLHRQAEIAARKLHGGLSQTMALEDQASTTNVESELISDTVERLIQKPALLWRALR